MVNIGKIGTKAMSGLNHGSLTKYYATDMQRILKKAKAFNADKFERLASEMNATKEKFPITEIPELKAAKLPLWKRVLGKIFG